jgi:hypothetical protein
MKAFALLLLFLLPACSRTGEVEPPPQDASPAKHGWRPMTGPQRADTAPASNDQPAPPAAAEPPPAPRAPTAEERARYTYLPEGASIRPLDRTVAVPAGYERVALTEGTFGSWLRGLPLRDASAEVHAYDGSVLRRADDRRVWAVAELDVSPLDVQQCADSVIRLHAEWLWSRGEKAKIGYHFLSGDFAQYQAYASGERPLVDGNKVKWARSGPAADNRKTFRSYLDMVFNYASTISLAQRTKKLDKGDLAPGDFFVLPGGPGHAILILDVATDPNGKRVALLGQGFMPAQDFHVLESGEAGVSPWFSLEADAVDTPFWPEAFPWSSLRRFAG